MLLPQSICRVETTKKSSDSHIQSGVAPANQTKESDVRELSGKESDIYSGTLFFGGVLHSIYKQKGVLEPVPDSKPHFLRFGLPELFPDTRGLSAGFVDITQTVEMTKITGIQGANDGLSQRRVWKYPKLPRRNLRKNLTKVFPNHEMLSDQERGFLVGFLQKCTPLWLWRSEPTWVSLFPSS